MGPDPTREVPLPLIEKEIINHDTRRYRFGLNDGHRLGLPVGKHISARAEINGKMVQRSYTPISSDDDLGYVDLIIKVYFPNEQFPEGGQMTQHMESLKIGDRLTFVGPKGRITYKRNGNFVITKKDINEDVSGINHISMIAGGSGITPMLQIAREVFKNSAEKTKVSLLFANKTPSDILLRSEIEEMKAKHPDQFSFMYTVDNASSEENWKYQTGYINADMISKSLAGPAEDNLTLICGPPGMIKFACLPNLEKLGHKENRIFVY